MKTTNPAKAGSLTLDTRLTMAEMPDMALNKIMVGQGLGNSPVEEDKPAAGIWTLLETLSPAAAASISSSALTAYDMFMIVFSLIGSQVQQLAMRLNGDAGNNYGYRQVDDSTWTTLAAQNRLSIVEHTAGTLRSAGVIYLPGTLGATYVPVVLNVATAEATGYLSLNGDYVASANITSFTFLVDAGTITGKIKIYGMNM